MPVLFSLYTVLRTIKCIAHLLDDLLCAPHPDPGFTQSYHLEVQPGIRLAEVGIHILTGKEQNKVAIGIGGHPAGTLPVKDGTGCSIFDPVVKVCLGDARVRWCNTEGDLLRSLAAQGQDLGSQRHILEPAAAQRIVERDRAAACVCSLRRGGG